MLIKRQSGNIILPSEITPREFVEARRHFIKQIAVGAAGSAGLIEMDQLGEIALFARWRDDGTAPTATVGMLLSAGQTQTFSGDLAALKFIQTGAGVATLNVSFYS